jgi:TRAP-type mannitol/chloroaromatic compound transport system substrate-binding protein
MVRFKHLVAAAGAAAIAAGLMAGPAQAQKYEFKLTSYVPLNSGTWINYMQRFIDAAHLLTNGEVKIKGFGVGVIAGPFDAWEAVQKGTADMAYNYPGFAVNADPANGVFGGMVGGMPMEQFMHWYVAADGTKLLEDFRHETQQLHPLVTGIGSTEFFLHSHKRVEKLDDLKGMKIRTAGPWAQILNTIGARATTIPPADIYTALERRVIDGTEYITPSTNIKVGFHKVAKFIIMPGIHNPSHMNEVVFRLDAWNKMPKNIRDQLSAAATLSGYQTAMHLGVQDLDAVEQLQKGRNTWVTLSAETQEKIKELGRAWSFEQAKAQSAKGNPWMQRASDSYWGFYDRYQKYGVYRHN